MVPPAHILYNGLFVPLARAALPVASRLHPGLRRATRARHGALERWRAAADATRGRYPRIWIHASSAGESLQAGPLVEAIRGRLPGAALFASWWSPSARSIVAEWPVDHADALPFDVLRRMRRLVAWLTPDAVLLVGAETWPNFVWAAAGGGARVAQACCRLAATSGRLRWPARLVTRDVYRSLAAVAAVSEEDAERVRALGVPQGAVAATGDTRVDATLERLARAGPPLWSPPAGAGPVLVAGSTHAADEAALLPAIARLRARYPALVAVVAPHDPAPAAIAALEARSAREGLACRRMSAVAAGGGVTTAPDAVIIVDAMGILYRLYAAADVAFVGGAFDGSVHNTMEPAAHGVAIVIGPRPGPFLEVGELERAGALRRAGSSEELEAAIAAWLEDPGARAAVGRAGGAVLERHRGATERTIAFLTAHGLPLG